MKQLQIPIFNIDIEDEALGLFGLSFVDQPAIQVEMHCFKNETPKVYFSSQEKREVVSPVVIPDQLIYREVEGMPFYLRASADCIKKMYERYMLSGKWNNFTYMHENIEAPMEDRALDGIYLQRLWIIEDEKNDDAFTKYGFENLPVGTMMMKAKVNNRQIWKEIKEGNLRGISLEALFDKINSNQALQITYSKMKDTLSLFQKFVAFLNEVSQEADGVASEAAKDETNSGEVSLKYYLDDEHYFEVDGEGFVRDENGELIAEGEYKLADGNIFQVGSDGKFIGTIAQSDTEEPGEVEAPIAEGFKEEEKKDEDEDKAEDSKDDGEPEPKADEDSSEDASEDSKEPDKDSGEEDEKKDDELDEEKPMINAIPYSIGGQEYLLPVEVINYIESLIATKVEVEEKLTKLADETPSAMPVGNVVKNGSIDDDSFSSRIASLSSFKGFGKN